MTTEHDQITTSEQAGRMGWEKLLAERGKDYYRHLGQYSSAKRKAAKTGTPDESSFDKWIAALNKGVEAYQRQQEAND